jgi:fructose-1,6-bisphosphatase/inositol monophosphatase family enzyme
LTLLVEIILPSLIIVRFIGEESVAAGEKCELTEKNTWIIDTIDGTTNFISSNPQICTILGFMVDKVGLDRMDE